ncbi:hypothetical protein ACFQGT_17410 [Natrialbaceae archaeon GCM10025810]|uniref:hypothetical protein n=1 Tax=Halovalidus salilacus TaxID=3075124 RepID=UPI00361026C4
MSGRDDGRKGFLDGVESSEGDVRVFVALNAILSAMFGWLIVWALDLAGFVEYATRTVAIAVVALFLLTFVVVR